MAINLATQYPGRVTAANANYTYGSSKNETAPGAGDGTPYELARANDIFGLQQALLRAASIVPNGNAETQLVSEYMQAIVELAAGRAVNYDESGIADTYVADVRANQQGPRSYFDGLIVEFTPGNNNTGASTINVSGLGVKNIFRKGVALTGGELYGTSKAVIIFDLVSDRFNLQQKPISPSVLVHPSGNFSLPSGALTSVPFDSEDHDDLLFHDNAVNNSRLTIPNGIKKICLNANASFDANATGERRLEFWKNGSNLYEGWAAFQLDALATATAQINLSSGVLEVVPGDYFELKAFQSSGGNINLFGANAPTYLSLFSIEYY